MSEQAKVPDLGVPPSLHLLQRDIYEDVVGAAFPLPYDSGYALDRVGDEWVCRVWWADYPDYPAYVIWCVLGSPDDAPTPWQLEQAQWECRMRGRGLGKFTRRR